MRNSLIQGLLIGAIAPLIAFLLTVYTDLEIVLSSDKPIFLYVVAAAVNLIMTRILFKRGYETTGRGVVLITFIGALLLVFGTKLKI
ncbi:hypothetical protein FAZ19_00475 [Sphingobacterium alkalisoli]|uniref:Stationary phase survival protein SurE n=1 Tax=Sphingobacterium alkalisoli TaxID=1874115 RepID=A0A4U0H8V8_9SPHI|nr:hypothetical protein [Sphingobacterium alkalisoli]TJY67774.1 hypothetical protein FAZ19_00475 [Sphingobacterium alkalisoli]GGH11474.1 hypothetical protein GCM10011418_10330 [Sphingobacterium alkalisoli]